MAVGKEIETRGHIVGFREEIARAASGSDDEFFTWFDSARDKEAAFIRGSWDFMVHIARPAAPFLRRPETLTALEIGYGGGRILAAASRCFSHVTGVDIHAHASRVTRELEQRGVRNVTLLTTDGRTLGVEDGSRDVVYSFIVLQHVEKYAIFRNYLQETRRVLRPGGLAVLYFGRNARWSEHRRSPARYVLDRIAERLLLRGGYRELRAQVNCTNLVVSLAHAKALARADGFRVLRTLVSRKKVPDGIRRFGGQHGLVLRKR